MAVGTTRAKRRLGKFVKPIRERSQLHVEVVAERVACSGDTIRRLESGRALPSRTRLVAILAIIGATDDERAEALELHKQADIKPTPIEHFEDLPAQYRRFRLDEEEASLERCLDLLVIPGLGQTSDYAREQSIGFRRLIRSAGWEEVAGSERKERQALLARNDQPLACHLLVGEAALWNVVGSPAVMRKQLDQLLTMGELPHVTIQVVPFELSSTVLSGGLLLLDFDSDDEQTAVYLESALGIQAVQEHADADALIGVWEDVASAAPSPGRSAEMIRKVRDRVDSDS
jgi:transcriptional regulator with XRE-family HTH domain